MRASKEIQSKIYELNDTYNELDGKRLKETDELKKRKYEQDMQKIKGMIEALKWVIEGE